MHSIFLTWLLLKTSHSDEAKLKNAYNHHLRMGHHSEDKSTEARKVIKKIKFWMTEPPLTLTRKGIPRRGTGGGVDGTPPEFLICCSISKRFCL